MRIDPALAALRRDPAPQHLAQEALVACRDSWREGQLVARVLAELGAYGHEAALAECPALAALLDCRDHARAVLDGLFEPMSRALRAHPLGHVPLRHQYSSGIGVIQLATAGAATLSLVLYEHHPGRPDARTVCFTSDERHELCLEGAAEGRVLTLLAQEHGGARLACASRRIVAGDRFAFTDGSQTKIVDRPTASLVILRLSRSKAIPGPAREFRIDTGALVHLASGDRAESRDEMAIAVLGAMGRSDALPLLAAVARQGTDHLRWQALCQALALDTAAGFALLGDLAGDPADTLAAPAGALRTSLIGRYPELANERTLCLA